MNRFSPLFCGLLLAGSLLLGGCGPASKEMVDEQKDPHYLNGRSRVSSRDFDGAIDEFSKAIENNPHSASAHLELAILYEEQKQDAVTAIYHYQKCLQLNPKQPQAPDITNRMRTCKLDIVKNEVIGPVNQGMQRELENLKTENVLLKQRVETLEAQLTGRPPAPLQPAATGGNEASAGQTQTPGENIPLKPEPERARVYVIKSGDMLGDVAKQYGISVEKLLKANPGVSPTRLKIGQKINIP